MTGFCATYTGRLLGHTMKFASFPISDAWLIKVATCVESKKDKSDKKAAILSAFRKIFAE